MINRKANLLFIAGLLMAGVFIYATTRSESIFINQWLSKIDDGNVMHFLQSIISPDQVPYWIKYSLPDALWMLALIMFVLLIWDFKLHRKSIPWIFIAVITGVAFEFLQIFRFVPGTFDVVDLLFVIAGALLPLLYFFLKLHTPKSIEFR